MIRGLSAQKLKRKASEVGLKIGIIRDRPVGCLHSWWRGDPLLDLPSHDGLTIERADDVRAREMAHFFDPEVAANLNQNGHRLYLARFGEELAAFGCIATETASIEELEINLIDLPPENGYLWAFMTLPEWRGRALYPLLLQSIVKDESDIERFWIGHDYQNEASARGIARAGFRPAGLIYQRRNGSLTFEGQGDVARSNALREILGLDRRSR